MTYVYEDPRNDGFQRVRLSFNEVKYVIPNYSGRRLFSRRRVFYKPGVNGGLIVETLPNWFGKMIAILGAPVYIVLAGFNEYIAEVVDLFSAQEKGKITTVHIWRNHQPDAFGRAEEILCQQDTDNLGLLG